MPPEIQSTARTPPSPARVPTLAWEEALWLDGLPLVAGVDEVGRGPLAGPVVAAAVVLEPRIAGASWLTRVRDSKQLSPRQREHLAAIIHTEAAAVGLGAASSAEVDATGIVSATRTAMALALSACGAGLGHVLIDALYLPDVALPQTAIIHGDALCVSIACASIVAKVARDRLMAELSPLYPEYGFERNKGYGTPDHLAALRRTGPSPIHRRSFAPVRFAGVADL